MRCFFSECQQNQAGSHQEVGVRTAVHEYGAHGPGITSHWKYPGAFLKERSVGSFWG